MILAASTQRSIGIVIAAIVLIGFITYIWFNVRAGRPEIGSEVELAANRKPYLSDEELESSKLDRSLLLGLVLLAIIGIGLPAYWLAEPARQSRAQAGTVRKAVTLGEEEYVARCQACHGPGASGGVASYTLTNESDGKYVAQVTWKAPALTSVLTRFDEDEVRFILNYGRGVMPAWGAPGGGPLTVQQIDNLIAYLRTIQLDEKQVQTSVLEGITQEAKAVVVERNPALQQALDEAKAKQTEALKEVANADAARKKQVTDQAKANVKAAEDAITRATEDLVKQLTTASPGSSDQRLYGQLLFNNPASQGAYNCARCHTKGWSYDGASVTNKAGQPLFPTGLASGGGWFGPNLTNGSTVRQFETPASHIDFITKGSKVGIKYGQYGQGSGRMPGFGPREDDTVKTTYPAILTTEQIEAIVAYEEPVMSGVLAAVNWAALNFDVNMRGILVVLTGVAVLFGSVWLIVGTNTGSRLATLITLSAFFGWMTIMATIWWMYGIGWKGVDPRWVLKDTNRGDLAVSSVPVATKLPDEVIPSGKTPYELLVAEDSPTAAAAKKEYTSDIDPTQLQGLTSAEAAAKKADWQLRNEMVTLAEIKAIDPALIEEWKADGTVTFGPWRLMTPAQSGEAVATASADLVAEGLFGTSADFKVLDSFDKGGKPRLKADPNRLDRITHWLGNAIRIKHPPRYAVVQVQQVVDQQAQPGEAPPRPRADPNQPIISVVMERNLGNKRFKPAMVAVSSGILFAVCAYMLHERDKRSMAARAAAK